MVEELHALHERLDETQARLDDRQAARDQQTQAMNPALDRLRSADAALASGSIDVDGDLNAAEQVLSGPAQSYLASARAALSNGDLFATRIYTELAYSPVVTNQTVGINQPMAIANPR